MPGFLDLKRIRDVKPTKDRCPSLLRPSIPRDTAVLWVGLAPKGLVKLAQCVQPPFSEVHRRLTVNSCGRAAPATRRVWGGGGVGEGGAVL